MKFITNDMLQNSTNGGLALNLAYQFVCRRYVNRVKITLKTDTTHFTIACIERSKNSTMGDDPDIPIENVD